MAIRVPTTSVPLQADQSPGVSAPRVQPYQGEGIRGQQIEDLGRATMQAAGTMTRIATEAQLGVDNARVTEARNRLIERRRKHLTEPGGYMTLVGKAAVGESRKAAMQSLEDTRAALGEGLDNDIQREEFKRISDVILLQAEEDSARHEAAQARHYEDGQTVASAENHRLDAITHYGVDPQRHQDEVLLMLYDLDDLAAQRGMGKDEKKRMVDEAMTALHRDVIGSMLVGDNPRITEATRYYEQHKGDMDAQVSVRVGQDIQTKKRDSEAFIASSKLSSSGLTLDQQTAAIDLMVANEEMTPEVGQRTLQMVQNRADAKWQERQRARAEMKQTLEQAFAQDSSLNPDTLDDAQKAAVDGLGMRADSWKIHREVRENRIADALADGSIDSLTINRDARTLGELERFVKHLSERKVSGAEAETPAGKKKNERIDKQIATIEQWMDALSMAPRAFTSFNDLNRSSTHPQGVKPPKATDMTELAKKISEALYPNAKR